MGAIALALVTGVLVSVGGCVTSKSTRCGEELCAPGWECRSVGGANRCIQPWQEIYCAEQGLADGAQCDRGEAIGFQCVEGFCVRGTCGDGILDSTEECDNGAQNDDSTPDACRTSCRYPKCGDGVIDPTNHEACDDGPANSDTSPNTCRINCTAPRCGDAALDDGEECDDGNTVAGDGCGPTCLTERCGNGWIDPPGGEQCDDGGTLSGDGCSSCCTVESLRWSDQTARLPSIRSAHAMAYDSLRDRVVLFGGSSWGTYSQETWEYDGYSWRLRLLSRAPLARAYHAMAFDPARGRVVLFGGLFGATPYGDTWEYDGFEWLERSWATTPAARGYSAMAYDPLRRRIVMFGGATDFLSGSMADTWYYDTAGWSGATPPNAPTARFGHAMAYDAARGLIVVYGGANDSATLFDETWEYDGATWTMRALGSPPSGRLWSSLTFDPIARQLVLFGGRGSGTQGDTWAYNGTAWSQLAPASSPPVRSLHGAVYQRSRGRILVFGGDSGAGDRGDTWAFDGTTWSEQALAVAPGDRHATAMAFDSKRDRVVLYSGATSIGRPLDTWEHDGHSWRERVLAGPTPGGRERHAMVYDSVRERVVLFGGLRSIGVYSDTWEYDGRAWVDASPASSPPARYDHTMTFDATRARVLLFGGDESSGSWLNDTWEYDGTTWIDVSPGTSPSPRRLAGMAFDAARGRTMLFGGFAGPDLFGDTWEFDGTAWVERSPAVAPPAGIYSMFYDARRGRILLNDTASPIGDSWEYDGAVWREQFPALGPAARRLSAVVLDALRGRLVLFGGSIVGGPVYTSDTWFMSHHSACPTEHCDSAQDVDADGLVSCADPDCARLPRCRQCGNGTCDNGESCVTCPRDCGDCSACSVADLKLGEIAAGSPGFLELTNDGTCTLDASGVWVAYQFDCDAAPQTYLFSFGSAVPPSGAFRTVEPPGADPDRQNESSLGASLCAAETSGGWVALCDGPCDLGGCSNFLDYVELQGTGGAPAGTPACATFTPAPVDVFGAAGGQSVTRSAFSGSGAAGAQSDWGLAAETRD